MYLYNTIHTYVGKGCLEEVPASPSRPLIEQINMIYIYIYIYIFGYLSVISCADTKTKYVLIIIIIIIIIQHINIHT